MRYQLIFLLDVHISNKKMTIVLSIDVGIKNLGYCLFDYNKHDTSEWSIILWGIENLSNPLPKCVHPSCTQDAKFMKGDIYHCKKHAHLYTIPSHQHKRSSINKLKVAQLRTIASDINIHYDTQPRMNRADLVKFINDHISNTYYENILNVQASRMSLIDIGRIVKSKLDLLLKDYTNDISEVIIENQISHLASRMRTLQGMITQYFIMQHPAVPIFYISSENKLRDFDETVSTYTDRKKMGIRKTSDIISQRVSNAEWKIMYDKHKKKDDLADAFLQGMYFINHSELYYK